MAKLLEFLSEMDEVQDQVDNLNREKLELEKELIDRGLEIYDVI